MSILDKLNAQKINTVKEPVATNGTQSAGGVTAPEIVAEKQVIKPEPKKDEFLYSTPHSDSLSMWLGGKLVQAKDNVLKLNGAQKAELDELIASGRPDITSNIIYIDVEAAEKLAHEHMAKNRPQAHKGGAHSGANSERLQTEHQNIVLDPKTVPEGVPAAMAMRAATAETLLAQGKKEDEEDEAGRRARALALQAQTNITPVEEQVQHSDDSGITTDTPKN